MYCLHCANVAQTIPNRGRAIQFAHVVQQHSTSQHIPPEQSRLRKHGWVVRRRLSQQTSKARADHKPNRCTPFKGHSEEYVNGSRTTTTHRGCDRAKGRWLIRCSTSNGGARCHTIRRQIRTTPSVDAKQIYRAFQSAMTEQRMSSRGGRGTIAPNYMQGNGLPKICRRGRRPDRLRDKNLSYDRLEMFDGPHLVR